MGSLTLLDNGGVRYQHNPNFNLSDTLVDSFSVYDSVDGEPDTITTVYVVVVPTDVPELHIIDNTLFFNKNGSYKIFDAVGNLISEGDFKDGVAVWDGINRYGRVVASSAYLVIAVDIRGRVVRKMMKVKR